MHLSTVTRQKSTTLGSTFFSPHGNQNTFLQFGQPFEKFPTRIPFFLESLKRYYSCTTDSRNRWSSERALEKKKKRRENDSFSIRLMDIYLRKGIFIINDVRNVKMRKDRNVTCIFVHPRTLYLADHSVFHPLNYDSSYDSRFWVIVPAEERQWDVRGEQKEISFHVWRTKGMKETSCTVLNRK